MPTNFERAKTVLDVLIPRAEALLGGSVDERVGKRCSELRRAYEGRLLDSKREPVDYSKRTTQIACVYRTLPAHADWVYEALRTAAKTMRGIFKQKHVKVACVGGGPGSDMLGLVKYVERHELDDGAIEFVVLDRETAWNVARRELTKTFNATKVAQRHQQLDLTEAGEWTADWSFVDADIFTLCFSLSEVWCYNGDGAVSAFLDELVKRAKSGALFVYVDNGGENFTSLIDAVLGERKELLLLGSRDEDRMRINADEQRSVLEDAYRTRFKDERVKMGGNVAIRVWQKK